MAIYAQYFAQYDESVRVGADVATQNGLNYIKSLFPYVAPFFVFAFGFLAYKQHLTMERFATFGVRIAAFMWLVMAGAYIPHVRDVLVEDIPAAAANAIAGRTIDNRMAAVEQFQMIDDAAANYVATTMQQATGFSQIGNKIAAWFARGLQKIFLFFVFVVWILMRQLAYLTCAVGAFMVIFLPFESTRHWAMEHFAKMFGITMWQVSASILLKIMLGGVQIILREISTTGTTLSLDQQVDQCLDIAMFFMGMTIMFISIPATVGVGASSAAASSIASGSMIAAGGNMVRAGTNLQRAGANLNKAAKEMSNRMRDNRQASRSSGA